MRSTGRQRRAQRADPAPGSGAGGLLPQRDRAPGPCGAAPPQSAAPALLPPPQMPWGGRRGVWREAGLALPGPVCGSSGRWGGLPPTGPRDRTAQNLNWPKDPPRPQDGTKQGLMPLAAFVTDWKHNMTLRVSRSSQGKATCVSLFKENGGGHPRPLWGPLPKAGGWPWTLAPGQAIVTRESFQILKNKYK